MKDVRQLRYARLAVIDQIEGWMRSTAEFERLLDASAEVCRLPHMEGYTWPRILRWIQNCWTES